MGLTGSTGDHSLGMPIAGGGGDPCVRLISGVVAGASPARHHAFRRVDHCPLVLGVPWVWFPFEARHAQSLSASLFFPTDIADPRPCVGMLMNAAPDYGPSWCSGLPSRARWCLTPVAYGGTVPRRVSLMARLLGTFVLNYVWVIWAAVPYLLARVIWVVVFSEVRVLLCHARDSGWPPLSQRCSFTVR